MLNLIFAATLGLTGQWQTECITSPEEDWYNSKAIISENTWTDTVHFYELPNCQKEYLTFKLSWATQTKAQEIDFESVSVEVTALTAETAEALNMAHYCGRSNWRPNVSQNISGLTCNDSGTMITKGTKIYSIFEIKNDQLRVGTKSPQGDGRTPGSRHIIFSNEIFLRKGL